MEMSAFRRDRRIRVLLGAASLALALWATCCGGGGGSVVVPVSTAGFSISSTTVNFGNQAVGTTSAASTATLINVGTATFELFQYRGDGSQRRGLRVDQQLRFLPGSASAMHAQRHLYSQCRRHQNRFRGLHR